MDQNDFNNIVNKRLNSSSKPKKGDKVISPFAGRELTNGSKAPEYGTINTVSRGYCYIDFGLGQFHPVPLTDMIFIQNKTWKTM